LGEGRETLKTLNIKMNTKLFIGNLSFDTTENELQDTFAAHGNVIETNLMMDRATGRPRGFAFVTMSTAEEAQRAIGALNGAQLNGRNITVTEARPKPDYPSNGPSSSRGQSRRPAYGRRS
jgi:cold-inducible RNA-binding protein